MRKFTRYRWHSKDGRYTFILSESGIVDCSPGPNSELMGWVKKRFPSDYEKLAPYSPPEHEPYIHWAYKDIA